MAAEPITDRPATRTVSDAGRAPGSRMALFAGLAVSIAVADQVVKAWIVANFEVDRVTPILGEYVRIALSHNTGALFGLFRDQAPIFALLSLGVIALIVWYQWRAGASLLVTLALGFLLGGALGNLTDRLRLGYVNDFMDIGIGTFRWYTFNVADASISASVLLLLLMAIRPSLAGRDRVAGG